MPSDDFDYLRGDIGVFDFELQLLGERGEAADDVEVVQQHIAPHVLLAIRAAVAVQVLLPTGHALPEEPRAKLAQTPHALPEHHGAYLPSNNLYQATPFFNNNQPQGKTGMEECEGVMCFSDILK